MVTELLHLHSQGANVLASIQNDEPIAPQDFKIYFLLLSFFIGYLPFSTGI